MGVLVGAAMKVILQDGGSENQVADNGGSKGVAAAPVDMEKHNAALPRRAPTRCAAMQP